MSCAAPGLAAAVSGLSQCVQRRPPPSRGRSLLSCLLRVVFFLSISFFYDFFLSLPTLPPSTKHFFLSLPFFFVTSPPCPRFLLMWDNYSQLVPTPIFHVLRPPPVSTDMSLWYLGLDSPLNDCAVGCPDTPDLLPNPV